MKYGPCIELHNDESHSPIYSDLILLFYIQRRLLTIFIIRKFVETRERKEGGDRTRIDLSDCVDDFCPEMKIRTANLTVDYHDANCEERLKL